MCCITEYKIPDFENQAVFFGFNSLFPLSYIHQKRAVGMRNHSQLSFNHRSVKFFEIPNLCDMGQEMLYARLTIPHIVSAFYFPVPLLLYPTIFAFLYSSGIASPKVSADFLLIMTSSTSGSSTAVSCVLIFPSSTSAAICPACTPDL